MISRIATSGDINDVFNIETQCFLTPWTTNLIASELEKPDYVAFAAVDNGKVCGYVFASCVLSEGEIERIAVTENMRRKGIGDELMRLAIEKLALSGVEKVKRSMFPVKSRQENRGCKRGKNDLFHN